MKLAEVETIAREWEEAFARRDAAAIAALYTTDAKFLPPNQPPVEGRVAIQEACKAFFEMEAMVRLHPRETVEGGDLTAEYGTWTMEAGGATVDDGKYVVVYRRDADGKSRLHYDIFNSDRPAQTAN